jgi:hypothetical protein
MAGKEQADSPSQMTTEALLTHLRRDLYAAACTGWDKLREQHPDEHWYAFALYTYDAAGYVIATANSEEALEEVARETRGPTADIWVTHRWSPCVWTYHCFGEEHFEASARWVRELHERSYAAVEGAPEAEIPDAVFAVCREVLRQMDAEGRFGTGSDREAITINLLMGDQSDEERLEWARELNPPAVVERLEREFADAVRVYTRVDIKLPPL